MKILCITTKSPYPLYEGRALRTYNLIKHAAAEHEVHLLSFVQTPEEVQGIEHMRTVCASVQALPLYMSGRGALLGDVLREPFTRSPLLAVKYDTAPLRAAMARLMREHRFDVIHLDMLHLADHIGACAGVPVVLMEHNVESVLFARRIEAESGWLKKLYFRYQLGKLQRYEAWACRQADHVIAVSDADADELRALCGHDRVTSIPNAVDTEFFRSQAVPQRANSLVFVGGLTWFPNADAIRYFCAEVLPLIAEQVPDVSLTVVGKSPSSGIERSVAENPRVKLTGLVDDVRPLIDEAACYVVPLRVGGGTRLKILDAMAMGKPLVSTSIGCEGLEVQDGRELLIADDPRRFADAVIRVLREPGVAGDLGANGRRLVTERYEWRVIARELMTVYAQCARKAQRYTYAGPRDAA